MLQFLAFSSLGVLCFNITCVLIFSPFFVSCVLFLACFFLPFFWGGGGGGGFFKCFFHVILFHVSYYSCFNIAKNTEEQKLKENKEGRKKGNKKR